MSHRRNIHCAWCGEALTYENTILLEDSIDNGRDIELCSVRCKVSTISAYRSWKDNEFTETSRESRPDLIAKRRRVIEQDGF